MYCTTVADHSRRPGRKASLTIQKLRRQLRCARQAATKYQKLYRKEREKKRQLSADEVVTGASSYLQGPALSLLTCQLRQVGRKSRGRRWSADDKMLALSIYHRSPSAYRFLSSYLILPSVRSLRLYVQSLSFEPGFCSPVFSALGAKVAQMKENDKLAVLCVDEMAVKVSLDYDSKRDVVDGFSDDGWVRIQKPASEALVFMVRGLLANWKQPLCYFLSTNAMSSINLSELVLNCIVRLQDIGIDVKVVVCDQGANNRGMFSRLNISIDQPFVEVNDKKVYFMYDPPHLLKSVRNNFRRYPVQIKGGGIARWDHVKKFYDLDSQQKLRLAPKLKFVHVMLNGFKKMNVRLAAQVLSHSAAVGISFYMNAGTSDISADAAATVDFLLRMDKIFDSCNGINFSDFKLARRPVTENSFHCKFWEETVEWLDHVQFLGSKSKIYCIDGFKLSLTVMRSLWCDVQPSVKFMMPRRLNQDCLESFFSSIRQKGGFRDNPSSCHFRSAMRQCVANKLLLAAPGGNCEVISVDNLLLSLRTLSDATDNVGVVKHYDTVTDSAVDASVKYIEGNMPVNLNAAENALLYVAGYVVRRIKNDHNCSCCDQLCKPGSLSDPSLAFTHLKAICSGDFGKLCIPSDSVVSYLDAIESRLSCVFPIFVHQRQCMASIAADVEQHVPSVFLNLCSGVRRKMLLIYLRVRMHSELPKILVSAKKSDISKGSFGQNRKIMKLKHV